MVVIHQFQKPGLIYKIFALVFSMNLVYEQTVKAESIIPSIFHQYIFYLIIILILFEITFVFSVFSSFHHISQSLFDFSFAFSGIHFSFFMLQ